MKRFVEDELPRLLDLLYDAAIDPERWPAFLSALTGPFGGALGGLHFFDRASDAPPLFLDYGISPEFLTSYQQHYAKTNPYPLRIFASKPVGKVVYGSEILAEESVVQTEFFNDWMRPQDIHPAHLGVILHKDRTSMMLLAVAPNNLEFHADRERYARRLELLTPHLTRAVKLSRIAAGARLAESALSTALQASSTPTFVLDASHRIVIANSAGEQLMRDARVVCLDSSGCLQAGEPQANQKLRAALATCAAGSPSQLPPIRLSSRKSDEAFFAWVMPIHARQSGGSVRSHMFAALTANAHVLLFVTSANADTCVSAEAAMAAFGLSAAEARLACALVEGMTLAEYAREADLSRNTVRNHLAAIFEKTGSRRQPELVGLLLRALGRVAAKPVHQ